MSHRDPLGATIGCAALFVLFFVFLPISCRAGSTIQVSDGFRDSTFRKMSDSGVFWVTTEAEFLGDGLLRQGDGGRVTPEVFFYTVADPEAKRKLAAVPPGTKVRVFYKQFLTVWSPTGASRYKITDVKVHES